MPDRKVKSPKSSIFSFDSNLFVTIFLKMVVICLASFIFLLFNVSVNNELDPFEIAQPIPVN